MPRGEIDLATVPELEARLRELRDSGFESILLDLRESTFLDSSGLRLILAWDADAQRDGFRFGVVAGPPAVQRVFDVTGVLDRVPFVEP